MRSSVFNRVCQCLLNVQVNEGPWESLHDNAGYYDKRADAVADQQRKVLITIHTGALGRSVRSSSMVQRQSTARVGNLAKPSLFPRARPDKLELLAGQVARQKTCRVRAPKFGLARNAAFLLALRDSGVEFVAADMPDANRLTVGITALVAEDEAERISQRTKAALEAAKARGVRLGGMRNREAVANGVARRKAMADQHAASVVPIIDEIRAAGITSLEGIATALTARGIPTARGGRWHASTVRNLLLRREAVQAEVS